MSRIVIGYLVLIFNFYVNGVNLLAPFLGYLFIGLGLMRCSRFEKSFHQLQYLAYFMFIVSFIYEWMCLDGIIIPFGKEILSLLELLLLTLFARGYLKIEENYGYPLKSKSFKKITEFICLLTILIYMSTFFGALFYFTMAMMLVMMILRLVLVYDLIVAMRILKGK